MIKIALIADIHGNLPALEAVLQHAHNRQAVAKILNLGDMTGYGPFPDEVVRWCQSETVVNILGNYDQKVISKGHKTADWKAVTNADKRLMFRWTNQALSQQSQDFLITLPEKRDLQIESLKLLTAHGSPASISEHLRKDTLTKRLAELTEMTEAQIILVGHSHEPFAREVDGTWFINPGSIGRIDDGDPRASYAILEIDGDQFSFEHFRVPYNIMRAVKAIRAAGLPEVFSQILRQGRNYNHVVKFLGRNSKPESLEPCRRITLLTDFGVKDHFVGVMKGVIANIAPQAKMIDISHQVRPQNIYEGANLLAQAAGWFPPGTVHMAVIDPGVGTDRHALAARIDDQFYIAPDNGLLTHCIQQAASVGKVIEIIKLNQPQYWLPTPGITFHGRDIFSPAAAHLANGIPLEKLGEPIALDKITKLAIPVPQRTASGWQAEVVMMDVFGNLNTNLESNLINELKGHLEIKIKNTIIEGITQAYADKPPGSVIALIDSTGNLAISIVNGNAAQTLDVEIGTPVEICFRE